MSFNKSSFVRQGQYNTIAAFKPTYVDENKVGMFYTTVSMCDEKKLQEFLLSNQFTAIHKNENGETPLHVIIASSNITEFEKLEYVKYCVENKCDVNASDKNNITPLHIASKYQLKDIVVYLIQNGAKVNSIDTQHKTPLHYAVTGDVTKCLSNEDKEVGSLISIEKMGDSDDDDVFDKLENIANDILLDQNTTQYLNHINNTIEMYDKLYPEEDIQQKNIISNNLLNDYEKFNENQKFDKIMNEKKKIVENVSSKFKSALNPLKIENGMKNGWSPIDGSDESVLEYADLKAIFDKNKIDVEENYIKIKAELNLKFKSTDDNISKIKELHTELRDNLTESIYDIYNKFLNDLDKRFDTMSNKCKFVYKIKYMTESVKFIYEKYGYIDEVKNKFLFIMSIERLKILKNYDQYASTNNKANEESYFSSSEYTIIFIDIIINEFMTLYIEKFGKITTYDEFELLINGIMENSMPNEPTKGHPVSEYIFKSIGIDHINMYGINTSIVNNVPNYYNNMRYVGYELNLLMGYIFVDIVSNNINFDNNIFINNNFNHVIGINGRYYQQQNTFYGPIRPEPIINHIDYIKANVQKYQNFDENYIDEIFYKFDFLKLNQNDIDVTIKQIDDLYIFLKNANIGLPPQQQQKPPPKSQLIYTIKGLNNYFNKNTKYKSEPVGDRFYTLNNKINDQKQMLIIKKKYIDSPIIEQSGKIPIDKEIINNEFIDYKYKSITKNNTLNVYIEQLFQSHNKFTNSDIFTDFDIFFDAEILLYIKLYEIELKKIRNIFDTVNENKLKNIYYDISKCVIKILSMSIILYKLHEAVKDIEKICLLNDIKFKSFQTCIENLHINLINMMTSFDDYLLYIKKKSSVYAINSYYLNMQNNFYELGVFTFNKIILDSSIEKITKLPDFNSFNKTCENVYENDILIIKQNLLINYALKITDINPVTIHEPKPTTQFSLGFVEIYDHLNLNPIPNCQYRDFNKSVFEFVIKNNEDDDTIVDAFCNIMYIYDDTFSNFINTFVYNNSKKKLIDYINSNFLLETFNKTIYDLFSMKAYVGTFCDFFYNGPLYLHVIKHADNLNFIKYIYRLTTDNYDFNDIPDINEILFIIDTINNNKKYDFYRNKFNISAILNNQIPPNTFDITGELKFTSFIMVFLAITEKYKCNYYMHLGLILHSTNDRMSEIPVIIFYYIWYLIYNPYKFINLVNTLNINNNIHNDYLKFIDKKHITLLNNRFNIDDSFVYEDVNYKTVCCCIHILNNINNNNYLIIMQNEKFNIIKFLINNIEKNKNNLIFTDPNDVNIKLSDKYNTMKTQLDRFIMTYNSDGIQYFYIREPIKNLLKDKNNIKDYTHKKELCKLLEDFMNEDIPVAPVAPAPQIPTIKDEIKYSFNLKINNILKLNNGTPLPSIKNIPFNPANQNDPLIGSVGIIAWKDYNKFETLPPVISEHLSDHILMLKYSIVKYAIKTASEDGRLEYIINDIEYNTSSPHDMIQNFVYKIIGKSVDRQITNIINKSINNYVNKFLLKVMNKTYNEIQFDPLLLIQPSKPYVVNMEDIYDELINNVDHNTPKILLKLTNLNDEHKFDNKIINQINFNYTFGSEKDTCYKIDTEVTKVLLEKKADPNIKDIVGFSPIKYAIEMQNTDIIDLLISNNATLHTNDMNNIFKNTVKKYIDIIDRFIINKYNICDDLTKDIVEKFNKQGNYKNNIPNYTHILLHISLHILNHQLFIYSSLNFDKIDNLYDLLDIKDTIHDIPLIKIIENYRNTDLFTTKSNDEIIKLENKKKNNQIKINNINLINTKNPQQINVDKLRDKINKIDVNIRTLENNKTKRNFYENYNINPNYGNGVFVTDDYDNISATYENIFKKTVSVGNVNKLSLSLTSYQNMWQYFIRDTIKNPYKIDNTQMMDIILKLQNKIFSNEKIPKSDDIELIQSFYNDIIKKFTSDYFELPRVYNREENYALKYIIDIIVHIVKRFMCNEILGGLLKTLYKYLEQLYPIKKFHEFGIVNNEQMSQDIVNLQNAQSNAIDAEKLARCLFEEAVLQKTAVKILFDAQHVLKRSLEKYIEASIILIDNPYDIIENELNDMGDFICVLDGSAIAVVDPLGIILTPEIGIKEKIELIEEHYNYIYNIITRNPPLPPLQDKKDNLNEENRLIKLAINHLNFSINNEKKIINMYKKIANIIPINIAGIPAPVPVANPQYYKTKAEIILNDLNNDINNTNQLVLEAEDHFKQKQNDLSDAEKRTKDAMKATKEATKIPKPPTNKFTQYKYHINNILQTILEEEKDKEIKLFKYIFDELPLKIVKNILDIYDDKDSDEYRRTTIEELLNHMLIILDSSPSKHLYFGEKNDFMIDMKQVIIPYYINYLQLFVKEMYNLMSNYLKSLEFHAKSLKIVTMLTKTINKEKDALKERVKLIEQRRI
jgi:ankyrin repeat protein